MWQTKKQLLLYLCRQKNADVEHHYCSETYNVFQSTMDCQACGWDVLRTAWLSLLENVPQALAVYSLWGPMLFTSPAVWIHQAGFCVLRYTHCNAAATARGSTHVADCGHVYSHSEPPCLHHRVILIRRDLKLLTLSTSIRSISVFPPRPCYFLYPTVILFCFILSSEMFCAGLKLFLFFLHAFVKMLMKILSPGGHSFGNILQQGSDFWRQLVEFYVVASK